MYACVHACMHAWTYVCTYFCMFVPLHVGTVGISSGVVIAIGIEWSGMVCYATAWYQVLWCRVAVVWYGTRKCMYGCVYVFQAHACTCANVYVCMYVYICMYVSIYVRMHLCICVYVCAYVCRYIYIYIYIHICVCELCMSTYALTLLYFRQHQHRMRLNSSMLPGLPSVLHTLEDA